MLIRPIYGPGQGVPNPRDLMPDDLSGADVMKIKTKCTVNVTCLNRPETTMTPPHPWKNCLPRNWFLVLKRLGTGDPGGLCTWTLTGPVEAVALWAMCRGAKESPLRAFQGVVRPHLFCTCSFLYVPFLYEIPEPPPSGEVRHLLGSMPQLEFMGLRLL